MSNTGTPFSLIYNSFLDKITDDMYLEFTELDTFEMLQGLLEEAIQSFEFPRQDLTDYELQYIADEFEYCGAESDYLPVKAFEIAGGSFACTLTAEEINILATYMVVAWLGQQLASIENTRMKFTSADFKMTSQANHMQKILTVMKDYERKGFHLQRLYKRRQKDTNGVYESTLKCLTPIGGQYDVFMPSRRF